MTTCLPVRPGPGLLGRAAAEPGYRPGADRGPDHGAEVLPRLLPAGAGVMSLQAHLDRFGPLAGGTAPRDLIAQAEAAGLTGRGGAAFPVHRKLAAVARQRGRRIVVGNGAESEPASRKDTTLLWSAPHLVLDGLQAAAAAVGADRAVLYLHDDPRLHQRLASNLAGRANAGLDRVEVELITAPASFLSGQESALVRRISGGPAVPEFRTSLVAERGVAGQPTLVQNVETLAHLALIARYGPAWFRRAGPAAEPGSMLCSVLAADGSTTVCETELGAPLRTMLRLDRGVQAVLCGGYHGTWLSPAAAAGLSLANASLRPAGAAVGAGVLIALPVGRCGLAETARVASYLATQSAGQCGPCFNGLPRMAAALTELAGQPGRRPGAAVSADLDRWAGLVTGRGACHHPDGSARFVRSALAVFRDEIGLHEDGRCSAVSGAAFLPVPGTPQATRPGSGGTRTRAGSR